METLHVYAVGRDCSVIPVAELSPEAQAILDRLGRCVYVIERHRDGISLNSQRVAELRSELARIKVRV